MKKRLRAEFWFFNLFLICDCLSTLLVLGVSDQFSEANLLVNIIFRAFYSLNLFVSWQFQVTLFFLIIFVSVNLIVFKLRKSWRKTAWFRGFITFWAVELLVSFCCNIYDYASLLNIILPI